MFKNSDTRFYKNLTSFFFTYRVVYLLKTNIILLFIILGRNVTEVEHIPIILNCKQCSKEHS
jgi:hypothetical protein